MRLGFVCYPTFGGSGVVATELGMALAKKGYEVHFITYKLPVRLDFISSGLHFHEVQMEEYPLFHHQPYQLALCTKMVDIVERFQLEVLHVHYAIPHAYAAFMAKQMLKSKGIDIKVVTTLHGTDITLVGSHPNYKSAVEFSINNSDLVTAVSENLKLDTERLFNLSKEVEVVYNFIELNKYSHQNHDEGCQRGALALEGERILTHVSNFRAVKRPLDVIRVFYEVQKEIPSKLLLVGEGPELEPTKQLARRLGILDKIICLGNSNEVPKILCYSDLFILPSETESFGLAALEAMAAKTPVISTNTGGLPEVNIQGQTGYLSDLGDVQDMAKNAIQILKNTDTLERFKANAFQQAEKFTLDEVVPKYEVIYSRALDIVEI